MPHHINYHDKIFKPVSNSANGETDESTAFHYKQEGNILSANYKSKTIQHGQLLGLVNSKGEIEMVYHQINDQGVIRTGKCNSIPEILPSGKIRLHEHWEWTSGDFSKGESILEEL